MNAIAPALVSFNQVGKHFAVAGGELEAIRDFNLQIADGEFVAIVGASGCGKSTLLRLLIGLDNDYQGQILIDGQPLNGIGSERGIVFQEHRLFPWLKSCRPTRAMYWSMRCWRCSLFSGALTRPRAMFCATLSQGNRRCS